MCKVHGLNNERGVALVTALMLTLIALTITISLLYMVMAGTKMSGAQKRYKTSREASYAAATELYPKDILPSIITGFMNHTTATAATQAINGQYPGIGLSIPSAVSQCLKQKVTTDQANWSACSAASKSAADTKNSPDLTFYLRGESTKPGFTIYTKIIDTVPGMSDTSGVSLDSGMGVVASNVNPTVFHQPSLYTFEVQGEREDNPTEKAIMEVLYAY